ncbi:hypothetical protein E1B28_000081 [Marasmius oreades]|uniref:Uncharacterized protein n=1 Tax=Marasmius oreades TaxID=181124 RepID=A0A9P7V0J2_9AGAR|nr:uncharacterized protein E1B28_000081 [Marasmius oreades]KAG7098110.1 hypothetical protein E1B28_000081 [Marasmius oreades]
MNNVHKFVLYIFYIKPSTAKNASVAISRPTSRPITGPRQGEGAGGGVMILSKVTKSSGGSVYCPHGAGMPFLGKVYADLAQQPLEDYAERFHLDSTIQEALCPGQDTPPRKPLLVVLRLSAVPSGPQGLKRQRSPSMEDEDVMPFTKNWRKFKIHALKGKMPSNAARSSDYAVNQSSPDGALLDGRFVSQSPVDTTAPPIELYHRAFAQFTALTRDPAFQFPDDDDILSNTAALIRSCSNIERYEGPRNTKIRSILGRILHLPFDHVENDDRSAADYTSSHGTPLESVAAARVIVEVKGELGSTGTDPSVQASFSFTRF